MSELKTSENGLTAEEAEKRLKKHGVNRLPEPKPVSRAKIFLLQFRSALVYILLIAGLLSFILGSLVDAGVIFGAVFLNVIIGFVQENKANRAIMKLKRLVENKALVVRDGQDIMIDSKDITIGDIILIKAGNRVPADARLIETANLSINEAGLTGESLPSAKKTDIVPPGAALADRENMVYTGTMAVRGWGRAVVMAIGRDTELGKIAAMVGETKEEPTPLQLRLNRFSRILGLIFGLICAVLIVSGLLEGRTFLEMLETGVAVGVASIPEGLTVSVTFILALGMQQILKKKALTRKLVAAETLGSTTVICTDKTGTLTEGNMHVAHIVIGEKEFEVEKPGSRQDSKEARIVSLALQAAMMCNDASIENPGDALAAWRFIGSPTETALLSAAIQSGLNKDELLKSEPLIDELPFDSGRKFMLSLHARKKKYTLYEKGAPEKLLEKSAKFYHQGQATELTPKEKAVLVRTYEKLTASGLRVIGLATREIGGKADEERFVKGKINWEEIDRELTFIGFIALKDPLRAEARETIKICRQAGIKPIIITGDHKLTARAIGEEAGFEVKPDNIINGEELEKLSDEELGKIVKKIDIYARVSPHHKLRIVKALQNGGEVVAMTGDGINDSPALKAADIGIALGSGTDIAKETSDIILLDSNFNTIVAAVHQGRIIFKNIRKVITYLVSDSFSEMILILGSILFYSPLAVLPAQILWINIVNDGLPDFSLAFEKGDGFIMQEKPIKKEEPLLNREMKTIIFVAGIARDLVIFGFFYFLWTRAYYDIVYLRTLIFAILGVKSLLSIFSLRVLKRHIWQINPFSNRYLLAAVTASFLFLNLGIYWRPLQDILGTVGLDAAGWAMVFGLGLLSIIFIEAVKFIFTTKGDKPVSA